MVQFLAKIISLIENGKNIFKLNFGSKQARYDF